MKFYVFFIGFLLALLGGTQTYADSLTEGQVVKINTSSKTVTVNIKTNNKKKDVRFITTNKTKYTNGLKSIASIQKGNNISITFYSAMRMGNRFLIFKDDFDCMGGNLIMTAPNQISSTSCYATTIQPRK